MLNSLIRSLLLFASLIIVQVAAADTTKHAVFIESFDGTKNNYESAILPLHSGHWQLEQAMIGKSVQDRKTGKSSIRLKAGGTASMLFDISGKYSELRFSYAQFGKDSSSDIQVYISKDQGVSWRSIGPTWTSRKTQKEASITVNLRGPLRLRLENKGPFRVNIDELQVWGQADTRKIANQSKPQGRDNPLLLGNPSLATNSNPDNYLLTHSQFSLSYNAAKGRANWVAWHLNMDWEGSAPRCNCFFKDTALPSNFYRAISSDYINSGFDRGHLCPSDDRSADSADNAATFLMSNIVPQAPLLNQQSWMELEKYGRYLSGKGFELYIFAGVYGKGGEGKNGGITQTLAGGRLEVPAHFWKIIVVLPNGDNDLSRITKDTRIIAVNMPNNQAAGTTAWQQFRCSVASIEKATGCHFFEALPEAIAAALKSRVDAD